MPEAPLATAIGFYQIQTTPCHWGAGVMVCIRGTGISDSEGGLEKEGRGGEGHGFRANGGEFAKVSSRKVPCQ